MARSRSDKMDLDKPAKKDKKYPIGKITKHERKEKASTKAGKHKPEATSDSSDDESSKASTEEGGVLLEGHQAGMAPVENFEGDLGKKPWKKETRLRVEALKILVAKKTICPSAKASVFHVQTETAHKPHNQAERQKQKRTERLPEEQRLSTTLMTTALGTDEGGESSATDAIPIKPSNLQPPSDDEDDDMDMEDGGAPLQNRNSGYTAPPSGMNRTMRRRLRLIEREKVRIQEELGVSLGSNENAEEVARRLAVWNKKFDEKTKVREAKKQERKAKQTARLQNKGGRQSAGGKLQEKENIPSAWQR